MHKALGFVFYIFVIIFFTLNIRYYEILGLFGIVWAIAGGIDLIIKNKQ